MRARSHAQGVIVEHAAGSAAAFHARRFPPTDRPLVWHFEVERPAVVLGSRQDVDVLDVDACRNAGVEVAHRRSGGGVVLLVPGEIVWVDVVIPASDARCTPDVRASMVWMGERWVDALVATGVVSPTDVMVHRGGLERTPWSDLVCFAGVGAGEVLAGAAKLVGISQRRTRDGARFQCAVHRRVDPSQVVPLLARPLPPLEDLPPAAALPSVDVDELVAALAESIVA